MYEGNKVLRLPKGIHFVIPEYVSESLAHNRLQPEKAFLIDLARMATMASDLEACWRWFPDTFITYCKEHVCSHVCRYTSLIRKICA